MRSRTWLTTDDKEFPEKHIDSRAYADALAHQHNLDNIALAKELVAVIWQCQPILSEEQLAGTIDRNMSQIMALLHPRMMPMM